MKIAMLLSNSFRPDPRVLKEAESLSTRGFSLSIICWDRATELPPEETLAHGARIIRIQNVPSAYGIGAAQLAKLPRFWLAAIGKLRMLQPDLVHCHDFDTLPAGLVWGRMHGIPVVYDAHEYYADLCRPRLHGISGDLLFHTIRAGEHLGARMASAIITVDPTLGELYRRRNSRVTIVGHYPSIRFIQKSTAVFTRPALRLLYIGRLSSDRGLLFYAAVLRRLLEMGVPARLTLAGVFTPESEEEEFRRVSAGLESSIDYQGWLHYDQIASLLLEADLGLAVLQPEARYVAALPVKLFEYMAAGLPVVASDFPAIREVVEKSNCGMLVDPLSDPNVIASQIKAWWQNPALPKGLGANGRRAVMETYNWESLMDRLDQLYHSLLN